MAARINGSPTGNVTTTSADAFGWTVQVAPPAGPGTSYAYDAADRLIQVAYGSATTTLAYDIAGRKTSMTDRPGHGDLYVHL